MFWGEEEGVLVSDIWVREREGGAVLIKKCGNSSLGRCHQPGSLGGGAGGKALICFLDEAGVARGKGFRLQGDKGKVLRVGEGGEELPVLGLPDPQR